MNNAAYKIITNDPCAFRKAFLKETLIVLKDNNAQESSVIELAFENGGITKPTFHNKPDDYDFYWVKCTAEEAENIAGYLFDEEAAAVSNSGETTPEASRYAELVDIWTNFRNWIEEGGNVVPHWEIE